MNIRKLQQWGVVTALILIYLGAIVQRPLFVPDEIRYSEIPREMIATGDWFVPHLAGLHYFEKPVLGYWLNAGSMLLFGERPIAARFPGAVATLLTAGLIWMLCRRAQEFKLAVVAPVIFLFSGLVFAIGTYGVLDAPLCFFITLTMTMFYFAWSEPTARLRVVYLIVAGIGAGLAFLTKGLLGFALPALATVPFLILRKEWKRIFTLPWIPLGAALVVVLPVAWIVHQHDADFWRQFLYVEHFQRALSGAGANDNRSEPFWYFIPVLLAGTLPWLLFVSAIVRGYRCEGRWSEFRKRAILQYAFCMAIVWFLFFSASSGKLGTYILPCFPAIALIFGFGLIRYSEWGDFFDVNRILNWLVWGLLPIPIVLFIWQLLTSYTTLIPQKFALYYRGENFFVPILALMVMLVWFKMAAKERSGGNKLLYFCIGIAFVMLAAHGSMPGRFTGNLAPEAFIRDTVKEAAPLPDTIIAADRALASAASWSLKRTDLMIYGRSGEHEYGLQRLDGTPGNRRMSLDDLKKMIAEGHEVMIITRSEKRVREMPHPKTYYVNGSLYVVHYRGLKGVKR